MSKLQPGMLALVRGLVLAPEYNGICVELVELVVPGQNFEIPGNSMMRTTNDSPDTWWICTSPRLRPVSHGESTPWGMFLPQNLMPLEDPDAGFEQDVWVYFDHSKRNHFRAFDFPLKTRI